jgi:hypothetical protein
VPKPQVVLTPNWNRKCFRYADISQHLLEMYGYALFDSALTALTDDKVIPAMREWQNRPLESL